MWWLLLPVQAFADLPLQARDAVAVGDCRTLQAAIPEPTSDEERLAVGWCQLRTGRADAASELLAPVTEGVYGEYARYVRGRALVEVGQLEQAHVVLGGLILPGEAGLRVRLLRGQALVLQERGIQARPELRDLMRTEVELEARYWLAVAAHMRGERQTAIPEFQHVWTDGVSGPWADLAAEALTALDSPVPDPVTAEGRALMETRADRLQAAQRHAEARALREQLHRGPAPTARTGLDLARARFHDRDYPAAVEAYASVLGAPEKAAGNPRDLFAYALATSRTGDYDTAALIYGRLAILHPRTEKGDFASFKLGYLEYDRGNLGTARLRFDEHIARMPDSRHLDEALWFHARCSWRMGDLPAAEKAWDDLLEERPRSSLVAGARYWKARARGRQGDPDAEAEGLAEVIRRYPVNGYAWFAAHRLGRTFPGGGPIERPPWPEDLAERPEVMRAEALLAVGLNEWALAELAPVGSHLKRRDDAVAAAHAFIAAGDYRKARDLVGTWCKSPWEDADPVIQQACYPMPERTVVETVADRYHFDPRVPFGIMVAESALKPDVTSVAGARGLMQLMPTEAPRIHRALYGDQPFDPLDLYRGPYNASLGTAELGLKQEVLGEVLQGTSLPAVIASYNAGGDAVVRWLSSYETTPEFDEFAEDIGYTETRQYVRRVLGHVMTYRWVYGDP
ncbi:MAG: transglycosylase SLT domain-containing protein [Deltaproteobacteria bacterium]|nr:transglycosylase SLT domain-containing protein [Deltaproteobacteria bacterium]MBW2253550.1 transglycosylase SLT domain-containing protein [Deltaproteobacteria bacterium]